MKYFINIKSNLPATQKIQKTILITYMTTQFWMLISLSFWKGENKEEKYLISTVAPLGNSHILSDYFPSGKQFHLIVFSDGPLFSNGNQSLSGVPRPNCYVMSASAQWRLNSDHQTHIRVTRLQSTILSSWAELHMIQPLASEPAMFLYFPLQWRLKK